MPQSANKQAIRYTEQKNTKPRCKYLSSIKVYIFSTEEKEAGRSKTAPTRNTKATEAKTKHFTLNGMVSTALEKAETCSTICLRL